MPVRSLMKALPVVFRVVTLSLLVLLLLLIPALLAALAVAWYTDRTLLHEVSILVGLLCALVLWLFVAIFHFKGETVRIPFNNREATVERLKTHLQEYGYDLREESEAALAFTPSFRSLLFGGGVRVEVESQEIVATGPKVYMERLQHRLRLSRSIDKVQKTFHDSRNLDLAKARSLLPGERRLKEVRIQLQVPGKLLPDIYGDVVTTLLQEGADVRCSVAITAQSEQGIGDQAIELRIRQALKRRGLEADIQKEALQAAELQEAPTPSTEG